MYEYSAKVTKIVDGDTIDVDIDLGFGVTLKQRVRLNGIDAPETRTKNKEEKELGLKAKRITEEYIRGAKIIVIRTYKDDMYGRILADVIADGINVNQKLIDEGFAVAYDGGKKS